METANRDEYLGNLKQELNKYTKKLAEIQKQFKGKAGDNADKILQSLKSILEEAKIAYTKLEEASVVEWEPLKQAAIQAFEKLKDSFNSFLNSSSEHIKDYALQIEKQCEEQLDCAAEYVKKNPLTSILIAAGVGFLAGRLFK